MKSSRAVARLAMSAAMVTVGSTIIASKYMAEMPPFVAAFLRFAVATPVLIGVCWITGKRFPRLTTRDAVLLCLQAGLGSVGYSVLLIAGLSRTLGSDASVIAGTLPAVAALLAWIALGERPGIGTLLGIALATVGVATLGFRSASGVEAVAGRWTGNALIIAAVACESIFLLLNKKVRTPLDPILVATIMSTLSLIFCAIPAWRQWHGMEASALTLRPVAAAVYYAIVPTVLGFSLWYFGASKVSATEAGLFTTVFPISGLFLSVVVLHETLTLAHVLGVSVCALGIVVGTRSASHREDGDDKPNAGMPSLPDRSRP